MGRSNACKRFFTASTQGMRACETRRCFWPPHVGRAYIQIINIAKPRLHPYSQGQPRGVRPSSVQKHDLWRSSSEGKAPHDAMKNSEFIPSYVSRIKNWRFKEISVPSLLRDNQKHGSSVSQQVIKQPLRIPRTGWPFTILETVCGIQAPGLCTSLIPSLEWSRKCKRILFDHNADFQRVSPKSKSRAEDWNMPLWILRSGI